MVLRFQFSNWNRYAFSSPFPVPFLPCESYNPPFMGKGDRFRFERLLRSAWEQQTRLRAQGVETKVMKGGTPWYQSSVFWGAGSLAVGIVVTVIAATAKDFRWLLFVAVLFFWWCIWEVIKRIRSKKRRRLAVSVSFTTVLVALGSLFVYLAPKPLPPAPVQTRPYELSGQRRKTLIQWLERSQSGPKETLRIGCTSWSEDSCVAAGTFLIAFSEAGWSIEGKKVFREEPQVPGDGIFIIIHPSANDLKKMQALPPYQGIWEAMDPSHQAVFWALNAIGLSPKSGNDESLPPNTIGVYFGPEPRQLISVEMPLIPNQKQR
jgi:hypothetical protein